MKLTIFGATGSIGKSVVRQALTAGHSLTVFTRDPAKLSELGDKLTIVEGDILDDAAVRRAVAGADAVLVTLGQPPTSKTPLREMGTGTIIRAMEAEGVKRLACLSALGVAESRGILPALYRYLIIPVLLRRVYADHEKQEQLVRQSSTDWVLIRPGSFTKGPRTGNYRHGFASVDSTLRFKISREDVADFLLKQITDDTYLHQSPALSY